jgi:hypothetical protein
MARLRALWNRPADMQGTCKCTQHNREQVERDGHPVFGLGMDLKALAVKKILHYETFKKSLGMRHYLNRFTVLKTRKLVLGSLQVCIWEVPLGHWLQRYCAGLIFWGKNITYKWENKGTRKAYGSKRDAKVFNIISHNEKLVIYTVV